MTLSPNQTGHFYAGVRAAITWLHEEAGRMSDPHARSVLNNAAFHLGVSKPDPNAARSSSTPLVGVEEVVEVLKPFAAMYVESVRPMTWMDEERSTRPDEQFAWGFNNATLTWGDFRKAQAILTRIQGQEGGSSGGRDASTPSGRTEEQKSAGRCATCRHHSPEPGDPRGFGTCARWATGYGVQLSDLADNEVLVENDEGWAMAVGPAFGCVLYDPAENSAGQPSEASTAALATDEPPLPSPDQSAPVAWWCLDLIMNEVSLIDDAGHAARRAAHPESWRVEPLYWRQMGSAASDRLADGQGDPVGRRYLYPHHSGGTVWRFETGGREINGSRPIRSEPVFASPTPSPPDQLLSDGWRDIPVTDEVVQYVVRYGGMCRDCADEAGVCPGSGLPCEGADKAVRHVLSALNYGMWHGYLPAPPAETTPSRAQRSEGEG